MFKSHQYYRLCCWMRCKQRKPNKVNLFCCFSLTIYAALSLFIPVSNYNVYNYSIYVLIRINYHNWTPRILEILRSCDRPMPGVRGCVIPCIYITEQTTEKSYLFVKHRIYIIVLVKICKGLKLYCEWFCNFSLLDSFERGFIIVHDCLNSLFIVYNLCHLYFILPCMITYSIFTLWAGAGCMKRRLR